MAAERTQRIGSVGFDDGGDELESVAFGGFCDEIVGEAGGGFLLKNFELLLEVGFVRKQGVEFGGHVRWPGIKL